MDNVPERPLAIYFLLDASASMYGAALQAAHDALENITNTLSRVIPVNYPCYYSVLLYHSTVMEVQHQEPMLSANITNLWRAGGTSNLGKAWRYVTTWQEANSLDGVCFILTDGHPTDDFANAGKRFPRTQISMVGIGCGRSADLRLLEPYLDAGFLWHDMNSDVFLRFLKETCARLIYQ